MSSLSWSSPETPVHEQAWIVVAFANGEMELYKWEEPGSTVKSQYTTYWAKRVLGWSFCPFTHPDEE